MLVRVSSMSRALRFPGLLSLGLVLGCVANRDARPSYAGPTIVGAVSGAADPATDTPPAAAKEASASAPESRGTEPAPASETGASEPQPSLCDDVAGAALVPPVTCDGPRGTTTTETPPNSLYSTSWFGCYFGDDGEIVKDRLDNCEFACGNRGLCPVGQSGPQCEANLRWFAADADRYGCGGRIRVTNCANGNAVVLATLDRGPNCDSVEKACDTPVLDMSHDAMVFLFDGATHGGCDRRTVVVEAVASNTRLGPV